MQKEKTSKIRAFLVRAVADGQRSPTSLAAKHFGITRQAANWHLRNLVKEGLVVASGRTRARTYGLVAIVEKEHTVPLGPHVEEHRVWKNCFSDALADMSQNVLEICEYGLTEILNNAKDHSGGSVAKVSLRITAADIQITVRDDGIGIFRKIKEGLGLSDEREAILELAKGKITTDPSRHTGEGVFFTSRMFDEFRILSRHLFFSHKDMRDDWLVEALKSEDEGTFVVMRIDRASARTTKDVYDRYASEANDFAFTRTHVAVRLLRIGKESLVSRSQAKRLLARFDRFGEVVLDFDGIDSIGQAFADEIFRVFQNKHPEVRLIPVNESPEVARMIRRATGS